MKSKRPLWIAVVVFLIATILTQFLTYQQYLIFRDNELEKITAEANKVSDKLKTSLSYSLSATKTLAFYVEKYGVPENFESIGRSILESNKFIDAVELATKGVITHVYPDDPNRKAIGYDMLIDSLQNREALKAIEKKSLFFAGPLELKQGGVAVVGRLPIFKDNTFWGFSVVLIKLSTLLMAAGINANENNGYNYQLSKFNPNNGKEEFFMTGGAPENGQFVSVEVPDGEWKLYVIPKKKSAFFLHGVPFLLLGLVLSFFVAMFGWQLARQPEKLREEVNRISREITSLQKASTDSLEHANRLYHFISRINHMIIHVDNEQNLYSEVCEISYSTGKYKMVWIGKINESEGNIFPAYSSGDRGYLSEITPLHIRENDANPVIKMLRTGSYVYSHDIAVDPALTKALAHGYLSSIIFPIKKFGKVVGAFSLYSEQVSYFDEKEIQLLGETANNISFTLENFEKENMRRKAEDEIQMEKAFSDSIINSLPGAFYLYDRNGKFFRWNRNLEIVSGYSTDEIKSMHPLDLFGKEEKGVVREKIIEVFTGGYAEVSAALCAKDGRFIPYHFNGRKVTFNGLDFLIGMGLDITDRVEAEKALFERTEEIEKLSAHLQNIREEERSSIALEIHDVLGQHLTALKMDATWIKKRTLHDHEVSDRISQMLILIDDTIKTVRRISSELRPGILDDLGIVAAIEWQGAEFQKNTGVEVTMESNVSELELERNLSINLFRIYQEALTNIARHARATHVHTILNRENDSLKLEVKDDGNGIDFGLVKKTKSLGLISMKERARLFSGVVSVENSPPKGTVVKVWVPLSKNEKKVLI